MGLLRLSVTSAPDMLLTDGLMTGTRAVALVAEGGSFNGDGSLGFDAEPWYWYGAGTMFQSLRRAL